MRERHKERFVDATAELRMRHRAMAKRVKALEMQLSRNTVSFVYTNMTLNFIECVCLRTLFLCLVVNFK